jgi:hypothetical protein
MKGLRLRSRGWIALFLAAGLMTAIACEKPRKKPVLTKDQMRRIQAAIVKADPKPKIPIGANFADKLELIGIDLEPKTVSPGAKVRVTWYWRCKASSPGSWKIFVHNERPGQQRTTHDHHAVDGLYMIEEWKPGEIIKDQQILDIDPKFPAGEAVLYIGIFDEQAWAARQENVRMTIKDAGKGRHDGQKRLEVARITIKGKAAAKTPAKGDAKKKKVAYRVLPTTTAPAIDAKLTDEVWSRARWTPAFRQPDDKPLDVRFRTRAKLLYDKDNLYVAFEVLDPDINNDKTGRDSELWRKDVVEVYLDPGHDGKDYVELQFSPAGEIFDAHFSARRKPEWKEAAKRLTMAGLEVKVAVEGTVNKPGDKDRLWMVEAKIPFAQIPGVKAAPGANAKWGLNLYRIDDSAPDRVAGMGALAPVGGDFHDLSGAAELIFLAARPTAPAALAPKVAPGVKKVPAGVKAIPAKVRPIPAMK